MSGLRTLRLTLLLTAAIAGVVLPIVPGAAVTRTDPDDTDGRLDLRRLAIVKDASSGPLRITVTTWGGWPAKILRASSPNRLFVDLDTDLDGADEITIRIVRSGGSLVAEIRDSGQVLQELAVRRPSRRKVRFTIESGSPANPPGAVAAAARSRFRGGAACRPCDDRAPDSGWVEVAPGGGGGGGGFACTQVVGFSQTREWFLDAPDFEDVVGSDGWQLLWRGGAGIDKWADPDFRGWLEPIRSPCASGEDDPDRVVLSISRQAFESDVDVWVQDIRAAVETTRGKYPNLEQIVLQPVVGGPDHQTCEFQGGPVRASVNHPTIDQAISDVVGGDVVAGASPEVRTCEDYEDTPGHLTAAAAGPVGRTIGEFYD